MIHQYYGRSLLKLIQQVQELREDPWGKPELCYSIQETLLHKTLYVERRIRIIRKTIKNLRKQLGTPQLKRLTKSDSMQIKMKLADLELILENYQWLISFLKKLGDCLAFIYIPKYDIKPFTLKETSGFLGGKEGLKIERKLWHTVFKGGLIGILNDLTSCLRHGDITVLKKDFPILIIEAKTGKYKSQRDQRQADAGKAILDYLGTDRTERNGQPIVRLALNTTEIGHVNELNQLIRIARRDGNAYREVEEGLSYYIDYDFSQNGLQAIFKNFVNKPIVLFLNNFKFDVPGYYPLALLIREPEDVIDFYYGKINILVFVDPVVISQKYGVRGFNIVFEMGTDYAFTISRHESTQSASPDHFLRIGQYLFSRILYEFLSLDWFLEEAIEKFDNPPIDLIKDLLDLK